MANSLMTVKQLSDHSRNWKAQLRVIEKQPPQVAKSGVTTYQHFILADKEGTRIQATCFDDDILRFDETLNVYKSYYFSNGVIRRIDPRNRIVDNTIQIMLNSRISIEEVQTMEQSNEEQTYNFIKLSSAKAYIETNIKFDIVAIATNIFPTRTITKRKDGVAAKVREILLMDESKHSMKLSAWDEFTTRECEHIATIIKQKPSLVITNVKANAFNECSLSTTSTTEFIVDSNIPEIHALKSWQQANKEEIEEIAKSKQIILPPSASSSSSSEEFHTFDINDLPSQQGNVWIKAKITAEPLTQRPWYVACNKCNRSTPDEIGTTFNCIECNAEECVATPRCILRTEIQDHSGTLQAPIFGSYAEKLIGGPASTLAKLNSKDRIQKLAEMNIFSKNKEYYIRLTPARTTSSQWPNNKWTVKQVEDV